MAEFESADVPLEQVAKKYLNMEKKRAIALARIRKLPFVAYQIGSQKGEWMVNLRDLADYIDKQRKEAHDEWVKMNSAA